MNDKLKVAVLYDVWGEDELEDALPVFKPDRRRRRRKKKKEKHDREEIFEALAKLGHQPSYAILDGTEATLVALAKCECDLIFNLTESYAGDDRKDMNIAAYLDLLGRTYTGSGPNGLYLPQDKSLAKKMFAFHRIRTPYFATSYRGRLDDHSHDIRFPLIVKPTSEDGSIGIDSDSVVGSVKELMQRIEYIQDEFDSPALIEEYIEGREIYAAVLGNENAEVLPAIELDLSRLPKGTPRIAGQDVKFHSETDAYKLTKSAPAENLDEEMLEKISETALSAFRALKLRDYGRIDMRLTKAGELYVIEVNPNPWLLSTAEFAMAAKKSGRTYAAMIGEIVDLARERAATRAKFLAVE